MLFVGMGTESSPQAKKSNWQHGHKTNIATNYTQLHAFIDCRQASNVHQMQAGFEAPHEHTPKIEITSMVSSVSETDIPHVHITFMMSCGTTNNGLGQQRLPKSSMHFGPTTIFLAYRHPLLRKTHPAPAPTHTMSAKLSKKLRQTHTKIDTIGHNQIQIRSQAEGG